MELCACDNGERLQADQAVNADLGVRLALATLTFHSSFAGIASLSCTLNFVSFNSGSTEEETDFKGILAAAPSP